MTNEQLLNDINDITMLVNPRIELSTEKRSYITETYTMTVYDCTEPDNTTISFVIGNVGVDFHYFAFQTDLDLNLPFMIRLNDNRLSLLLDEYYHLIDKYILRKLVQHSTYIENGFIAKECNL